MAKSTAKTSGLPVLFTGAPSGMAPRAGAAPLRLARAGRQEEFQRPSVGIVPRRLTIVLEQVGFAHRYQPGRGLEEDHVLVHLRPSRLPGRVVHLKRDASDGLSRRQHVIVGNAVESGADEVRALPRLIDGEVALRVALRLVDQFQAGSRGEFIKRHRRAGLRLAGGLIRNRAGDRREYGRGEKEAQKEQRKPRTKNAPTNGGMASWKGYATP